MSRICGLTHAVPVVQLEGADLPGAELDRAFERRDRTALEVDDPAAGGRAFVLDA